MATDPSDLPPDLSDALRREVVSWSMLEDVVRWGHRQQPPAIIAEVVIQDEYTHDVLLPLGDGRWLAVATT